MKVLHLSTDFLDSFAPNKTYAIRNLVDATADDFDHVVYSLNRIAISPINAVGASVRGWSSQEVAQDSYGPVWTYEGPDKGLFLKSSLEALGDAIAEDISRKEIRPDLIVGHKLSMEGIVAARISERLGIPYALSLQGNSDRNILNIRRDIRSHYKRIFHDAAMVFPFTPWALAYCESVLGPRKRPVQILPCISGQEQVIAPVKSNGRLMTAFHLRHREIKNLDNMLKAFGRLAKKQPDAGFDIYGGEDASDIDAVKKAIGRHAPPAAALQGPVPHEDMQQLMNGYAGFTMISRKESFGLVFIEALMAGCPVAYPQNAAIDGYFDGQDFALPVPSGDVGAITDAMAKQLRDEERLKRELLEWQQSGGAGRFTKATIAAQFRDGLNTAMDEGAEK